MLEINNTTSEKINSKKLGAIAAKFARAYKLKDGLSLAIVGPTRIKSLNRDYRGLDQSTDVLSFASEREIIINIADTKRISKYREMLAEIGIDAGLIKTASGQKKLGEYLLYFLFVHGLLHLAGYDDKTEQGRLEMIRKGKEFLDKAGF